MGATKVLPDRLLDGGSDVSRFVSMRLFFEAFGLFFIFCEVSFGEGYFAGRGFFCIYTKDNCISLRIFESSENFKFLNGKIIT